MNGNTALIAAAEAYMAGCHFAINDEAKLFLMVPSDTEVPTSLIDDCRRHHDELRQMTLEGIRRSLDGYQPALDGLEREGASHD